MEKKISYLSRDFQSIKGELIEFTKKYYPELSDKINDASVGSWFIDLLSAVGDDLSYHTDRMYQEINLDNANSRSAVLNAARLNGVKIPGPKCSVCEVEISVILPIGKKSAPNWDSAPLIKRGSTVGNMTYQFELMEDVDFASQFNIDGVSNRKYVPIRNANGVIEGYKVTKTVVVYSGESKIYKKVLTEDDIMPFMEIILPEQNICNVESIIFKEASSLNSTPQMFEFYIDEEEYMVLDQDIATYRYFEVNSLSDQYRFSNVTNFIEKNGKYCVDISSPEKYEDYNENGGKISRYFYGEWKPITQKFITEYTDNNYLKVIFGCGTDMNDNEMLNNASIYTNYIASKIVNNDMLGLLPKSGWVMYVLYRVGGGSMANLGIGSINKIINSNIIFPNANGTISDAEKSVILQSLKVSNTMSSIGGKDAPSTEEIKYMTKYCISNNDRCVTLKDYKSKVMMIPPKYGCPFRCNAAEDNNKISLSVLSLTPQGNLTDVLPKLMADNLVEYLTQYKMLTDYVEIRSGKVYNLGFEIDVFIDKNYTTTDVVNNVIKSVSNYFDINRRDMGEDIFVGDLEREINGIDGVISLIDLKAYSIYGGDYSKTVCPLPQKCEKEECNTNTNSFVMRGDNDSTWAMIDLDSIDHVLYSDIDSMFEIKNPSSDIKVRVKLR